jgi:archaea-specific DNA-binding protein
LIPKHRGIISRAVRSAVMEETTKTVIVGQSKPLLNYVTACITMFNGGAEHVVLRSRGEAINMAVDVAQLLRTKFFSQVQISKIQIDGEDVVSKDGRQLSLPVLEIELSMPKGHVGT